jgi:hypothetical protein
MAELKKKDEQLTTADPAGRSEKSRETEGRPQLVRNELRAPSEHGYLPDSTPRNEPADPRFTEKSATASDEKRAGTATDPGQSRFAAAGANQPTPLFSESEVGNHRSRWSNIQTAFVDEPRRAVEDADNLVASVMKQLAEGFANERARLEKQWDRGDNVSTEDLRIALQRYRSFFDRLLKV